MIDNRSGVRRFWDVTFPLLAPTGILPSDHQHHLFAVRHIRQRSTPLRKGEPGDNPVTLVYRVYVDGFRGHDLGGSSAQSVVLMVLVLLLTVFQFRFVERRIHYNCKLINNG
ncbi:MAG: hypothetical protein HoeaKO_16790 [Hoeflea alexandrii]